MTLTAIVKPTHDCNLACKYCYVSDAAEQGMMNDITLANAIEKTTVYNGRERPDGSKIETHFIWHGGEPLTAGLPFFQKIAEIEKPLRESGYLVTNGIQSNGTLIDEAFLDFCGYQQDFHLGLSLDGPQHLHDAMRPYKDGSGGSFDDVYRAVKLLQQRNWRLGEDKAQMGGGVICILNRTNIDKIEELYKFFHDEGINLKLNPLIRSGRAIPAYNELAITPREYGKAMTRLFDLWFYDPEQRISVEPFDIIMGNILTRVPWGCSYNGACQKNFISIGPTGAAYPCGRLDGLPDFYLGNINEDVMEDIDNSPVRRKLRQRGYETVKGCSPCEYKDICNAGCMHNAYMKRGDPTDRDYYCAGEKMLFGRITEALRRELIKAEVGGV